MLVKINCIPLIFKIKKQHKKVWPNLGNGFHVWSWLQSWQLPVLPGKLIRGRMDMDFTYRAEYFISYQKISNFGFAPRNPCQVNPKVKARSFLIARWQNFTQLQRKKGGKREFLAVLVCSDSAEALRRRLIIGARCSQCTEEKAQPLFQKLIFCKKPKEEQGGFPE